MKLKIGYVLILCAASTACSSRIGASRVGVATPTATDWRRVATADDRARLRNWRSAWVTALAKARAGGNAPQIAAEGALFQPDRALTGALPPPGRYKCRVFKLGAKGTAVKNFTVYPYFECRIDAEGDVASLYKTSGSQRPVGLVFDDGQWRQVFLGTLMLGDEKSALEYGRDADRDMAGILERIGPKRWRLVLPYPRFESILDVIEMVPAR